MITSSTYGSQVLNSSHYAESSRFASEGDSYHLLLNTDYTSHKKPFYSEQREVMLPLTRLPREIRYATAFHNQSQKILASNVTLSSTVVDTTISSSEK